LAMADRRGDLAYEEQMYLAGVESRLNREASKQPTGFLWLPELAGYAGQWSQTVPEAFVRGIATAEGAMATAGIAGQLGPQALAPEEVVTLPIAGAAGFTIGFTKEMFRQSFELEGGNAYRDMIAAGYDPERAAWAADAVGLVNGSLELVGMGIVTKPIRAGIMRAIGKRVVGELGKDAGRSIAWNFAKDYLKAQGGEIGPEVLQEVSNIVGEWAASQTGKARADGKPGTQTDPITEGEVIDRLSDIAIQTAKGMALLSLPGPVIAARQRIADAKAAEAVGEWAKAMAGVTEVSKLAERAPEEYAALMQQAADEGGNGTLYFNARDLGQVLKQQDKADTDAGKLVKSAGDRLEAVVPGLSEQLARAEEAGGDVQIQAGAYTAIAKADPKIAAEMGQLVRIDPDHPAPRDAADVMKEAEAILEAEKEAGKSATLPEGTRSWAWSLRAVSAAATAQKRKEFAESAQRVESELQADIAKAVKDSGSNKIRPVQVQGTANIGAQMVAQLAEGTGKTPEQLFNEFRPAFLGGVVEQDAQTLQQPSSVKTDTTEFRAWFGESKVVDEAGKPMVVYHGTKSPTEDMSFDFSKIGTNGRAEGAGFYFTTDQRIAEGYATGTLLQTWLAIKKPMPFDQKGFTATQLRKIVKRAAELEAEAQGSDIRDGFLSNYGDTYKSLSGAIADAAKLIAADELAVDQMGGMVGSGLSPEFVNKAVTEVTGFDGIVSKGFGNQDRGGGTIYVAFQPEQVKSVNNRGTFDPNDPNILRQPARGPTAVKTETPEFRAWFGESKVVDDAGKPLRLFHSGTFDEQENVPVVVGSTGMHFGTRQAAEDRAGAASTDAWLRDLRVEEQDGRWFWTSGSDDSFDIRDEGGFDSEDDARADAEVFAVNQQQDSYEPIYTEVFLSIKNPKRVADQRTDEAWTAAIAKAKAEGYDGLVYRNEFEDKGSDSYVVFAPTQIKSVNNRGTFDPNDPNILRQPARGQFGRSRLAILFGEKADASTVLHELTHWYVEVLLRMAQTGTVPPAIQTQLDALWQRWGVADVTAWNALSSEQQRKHLEDISYNAEEYFATGEAPSKELASLFSRIRTWITRIYHAVRDTLNAAYQRETGADLPALTPELRQFFDRMLAADDAIEAATSERNAAPLFFDEKLRKEAGVTEEQWQELQEFDRIAKDEAKAVLTEKALRGLERFENSRNKAVREMAQAARKKRQEFRAEAEKEVAARPVYRAIKLLRDGVYVAQDGSTEAVPDGERVRLDAKAVRRILGVEEQAPKFQTLVARIVEMGGINPKGYPGEKSADYRRLMPGLFSNKGMNWEELAQALEADGFGPLRPGRQDGDTVEAADYSWFYGAVDDAAGGLNTYRREDAAKMQAEGPQSDELTQAKEQARKAYRRLVAIRVVQAEGGVSPDMIAEQFGWQTGSEMLNEMALAPSVDQAVTNRTNERMDAEFGDLTDPKKVRDAIIEALHNEARGRFLAAELRALSKATTPTANMMAAAREAARQAIRSMEVGKISVRGLMAEERQAARDAERALLDGDTAKAIEAKRRHLFRHYLTREAVDVEKRVAAFLDRSDKFFGDDTEIAKKRNLDVVQALRSILAAHGMAPGSVQERADAYMAILSRENPEEYERLAPRVAEANANAKPYREITWDAFRIVVDEVEALWHEAKRGEEFHTYDGKVMRAVDARDELVAAAMAGPLGKAKPVPFGVEGDSWGLADIRAGLTHLEHWVRMVDGKEGGVWHRYVYRTLNEAYQRYLAGSLEHQTWFRDTIAKLDNLHGEKIDASAWLGTGVVFRDREHLLGAVFQSGNEDNLRRMVLGWGWGEQLANGDLSTKWWQFMDAMQERGILTKNDYDVLQEMWDYNSGKLRSAMQRVNRALYGTYVKEISGTPFQTRFGTYKGGYAPSKLDPDHPKNASKLKTEKGLDGIQKGETEFRQQFASVPRGMTIQRKNNAVFPRLLSLELQGSHLDDMLRFVEIQPALTDVARLFKRGEVAELVATRAPKMLEGLLLPAMERMARNSITKPMASKAVQDVANWLRRSTGMGFLGFSVRNWLQQYTGISNALPYVPASSVWNALWNYRGSSGESTLHAFAKSPYMRNTLSPALQEVQDDLRTLFEPGARQKLAQWANRYGYFLQRMADFQVRVVVWNAAYSDAIAKLGPIMEPDAANAEAVQRADSVVRRSQGSRTPLDVANYSAQNAVIQLFTQFSDYPNLILNQITNATSVREMAATISMALLVPTLVSGAITLALAGGRVPGSKTDDGDDDKDGRYADEWAAYLFGQTVKGVGSLLPVVGPALASMLTETNADDRMTAAPALSLVQSMARVGQLSPFTGDRDTVTPRDARDVVSVTAALLGIPLGPVGRAWSYWEYVEADKAEADNALQILRGIINGR